MARRKKLDPQDVTEKLARMYAKYFATDGEDTELNLNLEVLESRAKEAFPTTYKKIERQATNLALGHRG